MIINYKNMKITIPTKIKAITRLFYLFLSIITIIVFWAFIAFFILDESNENNDCNVANIKLHDSLFTYVKESDECYDCASSEDIVNQIKDAEADDNIKAIILNIDSSGGWPVAAQEIADALKSAKKPSVAWIRDTGASAAYFAATGADRIFASDLSDVGSIGVTMSYLDNSKKNQKDGLTFNSLSIGAYKDTGNPDKILTKEERDLLMSDLQKSYDIFVANVAENRNLSIEKVRELADGNTMKGREALEVGLIDQLGGLFDIEKYLKDRIGDVVLCR